MPGDRDSFNLDHKPMIETKHSRGLELPVKAGLHNKPGKLGDRLITSFFGSGVKSQSGSQVAHVLTHPAGNGVKGRSCNPVAHVLPNPGCASVTPGVKRPDQGAHVLSEVSESPSSTDTTTLELSAGLISREHTSEVVDRLYSLQELLTICNEDGDGYVSNTGSNSSNGNNIISPIRMCTNKAGTSADSTSTNATSINTGTSTVLAEARGGGLMQHPGVIRPSSDWGEQGGGEIGDSGVQEAQLGCLPVLEGLGGCDPSGLDVEVIPGALPTHRLCTPAVTPGYLWGPEGSAATVTTNMTGLTAQSWQLQGASQVTGQARQERLDIPTDDGCLPPPLLLDRGTPPLPPSQATIPGNNWYPFSVNALKCGQAAHAEQGLSISGGEVGVPVPNNNPYSTKSNVPGNTTISNGKLIHSNVPGDSSNGSKVHTAVIVQGVQEERSVHTPEGVLGHGGWSPREKGYRNTPWSKKSKKRIAYVKKSEERKAHEARRSSCRQSALQTGRVLDCAGNDEDEGLRGDQTSSGPSCCPTSPSGQAQSAGVSELNSDSHQSLLDVTSVTKQGISNGGG